MYWDWAIGFLLFAGAFGVVIAFGKILQIADDVSDMKRKLERVQNILDLIKEQQDERPRA